VKKSNFRFFDPSSEKNSPKIQRLPYADAVSGLEGQCLGAYLLSFDDSSATNRLGAMEHQRTKYELFWAKRF